MCGTIVGWGSNYGLSDTGSLFWAGQATPPDGNDYVAIAAGDTHSLAVKADGSVIEWGTRGCVIYSCCLEEPPEEYNFVAVAGGSRHSIALRKKSIGTIAEWGEDGRGCNDSDPPGGSNYIAIAANGLYYLALKDDGSIVGFGSNYYGESNPPGGVVSSPIVERYSYDVFGKPTIKAPDGSTRTISNFGNRFMFTGREYDNETGNYYYRARHYIPEIGRFLQPDPIGYEGGLNLYTYCLNNPTNYIDPSGLFGMEMYLLELNRRATNFVMDTIGGSGSDKNCPKPNGGSGGGSVVVSEPVVGPGVRPGVRPGGNRIRHGVIVNTLDAAGNAAAGVFCAVMAGVTATPPGSGDVPIPGTPYQVPGPVVDTVGAAASALGDPMEWSTRSNYFGSQARQNWHQAGEDWRQFVHDVRTFPNRFEQAILNWMYREQRGF